MEGLHPALSSPGNLPCLQQILNDWLQALLLTKTSKYIVREKQIAEKKIAQGHDGSIGLGDVSEKLILGRSGG